MIDASFCRSLVWYVKARIVNSSTMLWFPFFTSPICASTASRWGVLSRRVCYVPSKYNVVSLLRLDKTVTRLVATVESRARLTPVLADAEANALSRVARVLLFCSSRACITHASDVPSVFSSLVLALLTYRDESSD